MNFTNQIAEVSMGHSFGLWLAWLVTNARHWVANNGVVVECFYSLMPCGTKKNSVGALSLSHRLISLLLSLTCPNMLKWCYRNRAVVFFPLFLTYLWMHSWWTWSIHQNVAYSIFFVMYFILLYMVLFVNSKLKSTSYDQRSSNKQISVQRGC